MVRKYCSLVACCIAAILTAIVVLTRRPGGISKDSDSCIEVSAAKTIPPRQKAPLTTDDVLVCSRAFDDMGKAYSDLRFEDMQKLFSGISNKVSRLGKGALYDIIAPLKTPFRERFWSVGLNLRDFTTVSEFDRYMKTNVTAVEILGCSIAVNEPCDDVLLHYDYIVFRVIKGYLKKFEKIGDEQLAMSAKAYLDDWMEYLSSGHSLTRVYHNYQLKWLLKLPNWQAEDMGMKSEGDRITYFRNNVSKFHEQNYGVTPKWLDEDFPILPNCADDNGKTRELRK